MIENKKKKIIINFTFFSPPGVQQWIVIKQFVNDKSLLIRLKMDTTTNIYLNINQLSSNLLVNYVWLSGSNCMFLCIPSAYRQTVKSDVCSTDIFQLIVVQTIFFFVLDTNVKLCDRHKFHRSLFTDQCRVYDV